MITGSQCRAARALLNWTLDDLSTKSTVNRGIISRLENHETDVRKSTAQKIIKVFDKANVELLGNDGVTFKKDRVDLLKGDYALQSLWLDIIETLGHAGGEVLITNVDERRALESGQGDLIGHLEKLKQNNITERLLSCEEDTCFLMPKKCYRWLPQQVFAMGTSTYIYDNKVATQLWGNKIIILVDSVDAANAERKRFEFMWEHAVIPRINS